MTDEEKVLCAQKELLHSLLKNYPIEYLPLTDELQKISDKYKFDEFVLGDKMLRPLRNKKLIETTSHILGSKRYDKYQGIASYNIKGHLTEKGFEYLNTLHNANLNNQLAQSTLDTNKSVKKTNRISVRLTVISVFVIAIGTIFQIIQGKIQKEQTKILKQQLNIANKALHQTLHDSLCPLLNQQKTDRKTENSEYLPKFDTVSKKP